MESAAAREKRNFCGRTGNYPSFDGIPGKRFVYETQIYSDSITLNPAWCASESTLLEEAQEDLKRRNKRTAEVTVTACDTRPLYCDRIHTLEVLKNLLINAADAGESRETIELSYTVSQGRECSNFCEGQRKRNFGSGYPPDF